jgi:predicted Zn-dependent protease
MLQLRLGDIAVANRLNPRRLRQFRWFFALGLLFWCGAMFTPGLSRGQGATQGKETPPKADAPKAVNQESSLPPEAEDPEVAKQKLIVDRFVTVLERNPRRGTAFDKIYGFHIENGSVESLAQQFRERAAKTEADYAAWMILGLIESQRGRDAAAVDAFAKARLAKKDDPIAPYYHGQSLVLIGRGDDAVPSFEEAIARKPSQVDLFEIIQALGRVHQRAQRNEQALAVWNQFEKAFPGDARVQEQIAVTLVEEGQFAEALPRYEALVKTARDEYRRSTFQIEAAELKVRLKRTNEGITDLEALLDKLNPDSWLFREVRRKIENVFLRTEDQEGLVKYYTAWVGKHGEDVDAMARLSRLLAKQARVPEAREWLDKALKLAPSRKELRLAFIQQLVEDHRFGDAIEQFKLLDQADPNNPDYLREWGRLVMRDGSRPIEAKRKDAAAIWKKLLVTRGNDPLATVQVADLLRNAGMTEEALPLYEKAVSLAPTAPQYREFLGEYLHLLKRPEEALATWKKIADGKLRTPENLSRLAEVLAQFGYAREASVEIQAAAELDAKDFSLHLRAADYQARAEQLDGAVASLGRAEGLAQNDEEREAVLAQRIRILQQMGKLTTVSEELRTSLEKSSETNAAAADQWFRLARYQEALRLLPEATKSIAKSLELAPANIPALSAAARIDEQAGAVSSAVERFRRLTVVDRRSKSDYLTQIARLEVQMGRTDEALAAGRDLIAASPGNLEAYQFFADLCFRLNRREEGLTALRRSVRANPNDPAALMPLAAALAGDFRTDEAIEIYWQAFEKGGSLDDKLTVIGKLAELYLQQGQFDRLVERLDRNRKEQEVPREMTICLAQAHQTAGDIGLARQELQTLVNDDSRDTTLLQQLSKLAEADRDLPAAIRFQEQLTKAAPAPETELRLAQLYSTAGDTREASAIFVRLAQREEDPERLLRIVDGLLATDKHDEVLAILEPKVRENAKNWELLYREGVALFANRKAEAATRFRAILALTAPDDDIGAYEKARIARANRGGAGAALAANTANSMRLNPIYRVSYIYDIRQGIGLDSERVAQLGVVRTIWSPSAYFQARAAAIGWLSRIATGPGEQEALVKELRERSDSPNATPRDNWDWIYYTTVILQTGDQDRDATIKLAKQGDLAGHYAYLSDIQSRPENQRVYMGAGPQTSKIAGTPLPEAELNLAVESLNALVLASDDPAKSLQNSVPQFAFLISRELKLAKRDAEAKKLLDQIVARNKTPQQLATTITLLANEGDFQGAMAAFERFADLELKTNDNKSPTAQSVRMSAATGICQLVGRSGASIEQVLAAFNRYATFYIQRNELRRNDRAAVRTTLTPARSYYTTFIGGQQKNTSMVFPPAGQYWDQSALNVLRNVYDVYVAADLASDFTAEIEKRRAAARGASSIYWELARAYVEFWNGEKESAATYFAKAAELSKQDLQLQFDLANLHLQAQNVEEAFAVLERIQPADQRLVIQKETAILQYSQQLGDLDRAMIAAKRLFGMRIDVNSQMQLADSMRRLGMNEEAESVLKRAERQTGSRGSALAALMTQYLVEGKNDLAAEAAYRILRSTRATGANPRTGQTQDDVNRQTALRCLQQTGKLKDQIVLLEAQLERSPQSEPIYAALSEYYTAAGDVKKSESLQVKLLALRPEDADLRYRTAMAYQQAGKGKEACDLMLEALRKKPSLLGNQYYEVISMFRANRRITDLAKFFEEIELRQIGQYYMVQNIMQYFTDSETDSELAVSLIRKAIKAYPEYGASSFIPSYRPQLLQNPEIAEMARKSLIPPLEKIKRQPWNQSGSGNSYSSDGTLSSIESSVLDVTSPADLATLKQDVEKALADAPQWSEGQAMLAMIAARTQDVALAKKQFAILKDLDYSIYYATYAVWRTAQEYRKVPELRDETMELYRLADKAWRVQNRGSSYGPGAALATILIESGDKESAKATLLASLNEQEQSYPGNPGYAESNRVSKLYMTAQQLDQLGFSSDSLRVYRELVTFGKQHDDAIKQWNGSNSYTQQGELQLTQLIRKLVDQGDRSWVKEMLMSKTAKPGESPIDLCIIPSAASSVASGRMVYDEYGRPLPSASAPRLTSLLANVFKEKNSSEALNKEIESKLTELSVSHPADLQVAIAHSIFALAKLPESEQKTVLARLEKIVDESPLEELPSGKRPNARQRAAAKPQMALWLVAKDLLDKPDRQSLGAKLAERAMASAQRQTSDTLSQGLTFELAAAAAKRGDLSAAEAAYRRLIESAITPKVVKAASASGQSSPAAGQSTSPSTAPRRAPVTISQFLLAAGIAESAANLGLKDVSVVAIREAFSAGMPVADPPTANDPNASGRVVSRLSQAGAGGVDVSRPLQQVLAAWSRVDVSAADVSQILESIVMPANRPREILVFGGAANASSSLVDTGLLGALADWANRADRVAQIERQVNDRKGTLDSTIAGDALLLYIALTKNDSTKISTQIKALGERLKNPLTASAQAILSTAMAKAFERPDLRDEVAPHLTTLFQTNFSSPQRTITTNNSQLLSDLLQHGIRKGKLGDVKTLTEAYIKSKTAAYAGYSSGDTVVEMQYTDYGWAACVLSRAGDLPTTLESLARLADSPLPRRNVEREYNAIALWNFASQVKKLSPADRYNLLRDWTMPTAERRTLRSLAAFETQQNIPSEIARSFGHEYRVFSDPRMISTLGVLVEAAQQAGKLDELETLTKPLIDEKVPQSTSLALAIAAAKSDRAQATTILAQIETSLIENAEKAKATRDSRLPSNNVPPNTTPIDQVELAAIIAACKSDSARQPALDVLERVRSIFVAPASQASGGYIGDAIRRCGELRDVSEEAWKTPKLKHWNLGAAAYYDPFQSVGQLYAFNNTLAVLPQRAGAVQFRLPLSLASDWSFYFESADCNFSYGGLTATVVSDPRTSAAEQSGTFTRQIMVGNVVDSFPRIMLAESSGAWSRYEIRSRGGNVEFLVNDQLLSELLKDAAPTLASPWITISNRNGLAPPLIRNPHFTGKVEVLDSVDLITGDRSDGWKNRSAYSGRRFEDAATRRAQANRSTEAAATMVPPRAEDIWNFDKGEIIAPRSQAALPEEQGGISLKRPLDSGDKIAYEFFYQPGASLVHPALGNLDFLIRPEGIHLAWTTPLMARNVRGSSGIQLVSLENLIGFSVKAEGAAPLSLKNNDWNQAELSLNGAVLTIKINGQVALVRALEETVGREFSLFHYPREEAFQVRSLKLTGEWSKSLTPEELANTLAWDGPSPTREQSKVAWSLLGETGVADAARELLKNSASLAPAERYQALRAFVLPGDSHPAFRDQIDYDDLALQGSAVRSPLLGLIAAAKESGKLNELKSELLAQEKAGESTTEKSLAISVKSLLAILATEEADHTVANQSLEAIRNAIENRPALTGPGYHQRSAWLAAYAALQSTQTRAAGAALAKTLDADFNKPGLTPAGQWRDQVTALQGFVRAANSTSPVMSTAAVTGKAPNWVAFDLTVAADPARGALGSRWSADPASFELFTSTKATGAIYALPLAGDFVVTCKARYEKSSSLLPVYAGVAVYPTENNTFVKLTPVGAGATVIPLEKVDPIGEWFDYRIDVAKEFITISINGKRVLHEKLTAVQSDPWLRLSPRPPLSGGAIRELAITGSPTIPREVALSKGTRIAGWLTDYFAEQDYTSLVSRTNANMRAYGGEFTPEQPTGWKLERDEIIAVRLQNPTTNLAESLVRYNRPLATGDQLRLEFLWEAGRNDFSPAIGGQALLLSPEGVKIHQITTLPASISGLSLDNEAPLTGAKQVPLQSGKWNEFTLKVEADKYKIAVNGAEIGELPRNTKSSELFGLFRRRNHIGVSVKNVSLKGAWPESLP